MHVIYAYEDLPDPCSASLFLAGPRHYVFSDTSWRSEALLILRKLGYTGAVIIPEPRGEGRYFDLPNWEDDMRARADLILFWMSVEEAAAPLGYVDLDFGQGFDSCRYLYGRAAHVLGCDTLDARWRNATGYEPCDSLQGMLSAALGLIGAGAERHGVERDVPLSIWLSSPFTRWYSSLNTAGHVLRNFRLCYVLAIGNRHPGSQVFGFLASASVAVAGENRIKSNEVFLARPDTVAVLPIFDAGGPEAEVFLVREYRLAVRNASGFVIELPGGSSREAQLPPRAIALEELTEELGLEVAPARLIAIGSRQSASTLCSHHIHLFTLALENGEAVRLRKLASAGDVLGADSEERITVIRQRLSAPFDPSLDWVGLGLIATAMASLKGS